MICRCCGQEIRNRTIADGINNEVVLYAVAKYFKISVDDLKKASRKRQVSYPRHVAYYFLRNKTSIGVMQIGLMFNQHHSTVIYGARLISNLYKNTFDVKFDIESIEKMFASLKEEN